jgi:hypothetical protein
MTERKSSADVKAYLYDLHMLFHLDWRSLFNSMTGWYSLETGNQLCTTIEVCVPTAIPTEKAMTIWVLR